MQIAAERLAEVSKALNADSLHKKIADLQHEVAKLTEMVDWDDE